jgi:pimeloyl-ACP methyl ester carboxylesterase
MENPARPQLPLVLVPGLNGDHRVFSQQSLAFPDALIVAWIAPRADEGLQQYAARLARSLDLSGPCVVAGVSFGGIVALEMARYLDARMCILIASSRDPQGLPYILRLLRPVAARVPLPLVTGSVIAGWATACAALPDVRRRIRRLSPEQKTFQRWALRALLTWHPTTPAACSILQVHGDRDNRFPDGASRAERVVHGAGHLVTLTHGDEVNQILQGAVQPFGRPSDCP